MLNNKKIIFVILNIAYFGSITTMSSDRAFFSIINNTSEDFNIEISYGARATAAKSNTIAKTPNVATGESYQDKQLFQFPPGFGVDIQKTEFRRFPTYIRLLSKNSSGQLESSEKTQSIYQKSDNSMRKEIALGVDTVNNKNGVVINSDPSGALSFKFFDVRPDTKVIRYSPIMIKKPY